MTALDVNINPIVAIVGPYLGGHCPGNEVVTVQAEQTGHLHGYLRLAVSRISVAVFVDVLGTGSTLAND